MTCDLPNFRCYLFLCYSSVFTFSFFASTGEIIKHSEIKVVLNEGMPMYKNPFEKGRLIVQFKVKFPPNNWISPERLPELEKLLPPRQEVIIPDDGEECTLVDPDVAAQSKPYSNAYDSDDEDGMHGQRVQCASH